MRNKEEMAKAFEKLYKLSTKYASEQAAKKTETAKVAETNKSCK